MVIQINSEMLERRILLFRRQPWGPRRDLRATGQNPTSNDSKDDSNNVNDSDDSDGSVTGKEFSSLRVDNYHPSGKLGIVYSVVGAAVR